MAVNKNTVLETISEWNDKVVDLPWAHNATLQKWFFGFIPKSITHRVSAFIYLLSVISWVFAGQDKASYCLAYITTLSAYLWTHGALSKVRKVVHILAFVALFVVTRNDIAGYVTVPWVFTLACFGFYVFAVVQDRKDEFFVLAVASFVLSVWQAVDTDVHY